MRLHLPSQCPPCVPLVLHVDVSRARPSPHFHLHALLSLKTAENKTWGCAHEDNCMVKLLYRLYGEFGHIIMTTAICPRPVPLAPVYMTSFPPVVICYHHSNNMVILVLS